MMYNTNPGTVCVPNRPVISARWTPREVLRRDTLAGTFEHVNPLDFSRDAMWLQQALIYCGQRRAVRRFTWIGATPVLAILLAAIAVVWVVA